MIGPVLAMLGDADPVAIRRLFLDEPGRDAAFPLLRDALDQRPVGLLGIAAAECLGKLHRGKARAGNDQHARRVAVETMHKARLLALLVAERFQHVVDMAHDARAALHRKTGWLVENEHGRVLVQHHLPEDGAIVLAADALCRKRLVALPVDAERRNAHDLPRLKPGVGLGASAIDADLPRAQQLLQVPEAEPRKMCLEPAIEPHARLAAIHLDLLDACHLLTVLNGGNSTANAFLRAAKWPAPPKW
jgi:hypothetical protein